MKSILLTVGLAFIGMYATAQTRVIDYPVMGQRTTDALEFYQAEVSDTAVILRGDMYSRPNYWVRSNWITKSICPSFGIARFRCSSSR